MPLAHSAQRQTLLLAEDQPAIRCLQQAILEQDGYCVLPCADAREAEGIFTQRPSVCLLITDVEMPGRSGLELAKRLSKRRPGLPVLIVSGSTLAPRQQALIRRHRWTFLPKPVDPRTFLRAVQALLGPATLAAYLLSATMHELMMNDLV